MMIKKVSPIRVSIARVVWFFFRVFVRAIPMNSMKMSKSSAVRGTSQPRTKSCSVTVGSSTEPCSGKTNGGIRAAGARLGHVHLQDSDGYADRHWQLGQGTILWPSVFDAIRETGATPRLIIELRDKAGVIPSARHLAALGLAE